MLTTGSIINQITLTVPFGTVVTALVPTVTISGVSVTPASGVAHDFTQPATYTVKSKDGLTKDYTVTVTVASATAKEITGFKFVAADNSAAGLSADFTATPTAEATAFAVSLPYGTALTTLTPTITLSGGTVSPKSGVAQSWAGGTVTYTVTGSDGNTHEYVVTVVAAFSPAKDITEFKFVSGGMNNNPAGTFAGTITGTDISVTIPFGTSLTNLAPTFSTTGATVKVSGVAQVSATTGQNFDSSVGVTYVVTAADGSIKSYTAKVKNPEQKVYFVDSSDHISGFNLNSNTGTLTAATGNPFVAFPTVGSSSTLVADPKGKFLVANWTNTSALRALYAFSIDPATGALSLQPGMPYGNTYIPHPLVGAPLVSPDGDFVYVLSTTRVYTYPVTDGVVGVETAQRLGSLLIHGLTKPSGWALAPDGKTALIADSGNAGTTGVRSYSIANGEWTSNASSIMGALADARMVSIDSTGTKAMVIATDVSGVFVEIIAVAIGANGSLTQPANPIDLTGHTIFEMAFDPTGTFHFVSTTNPGFYVTDSLFSLGSWAAGGNKVPTYSPHMSFNKFVGTTYLYMSNNAGSIENFSVNGSNGNLTSTGMVFSNSAKNFAFDLSGKWGLGTGTATLKSFSAGSPASLPLTDSRSALDVKTGYNYPVTVVGVY